MLQEAEEGPNPQMEMTKLIMSMVKKDPKTGRNSFDFSKPHLQDYISRFEDLGSCSRARGY